MNIIRIGLRAVLSFAILFMFIELGEGSVKAETYETWGDWNYTVNGDEVTITKYNASDTEVVIPDKIDGKKVVGLRGSCVTYTQVLTKIEIAVSVFSNMNSLKSVIIPDSVNNIGYGTFSKCSSLKNITIPNSVTSIGNAAFNGCSSLKVSLYQTVLPV